MSATQETKAPKAILYNNIVEEVGLAVFARNVIGKKNVDVCALDKNLVLSEEKAKEEFAQYNEIFVIGTYWPWVEKLRAYDIDVTIINTWERKVVEEILIPKKISSTAAYVSFCAAHQQVLNSIFDRKKDRRSTDEFFNGLYNQEDSFYFLFDDLFDDFQEDRCHYTSSIGFYTSVCEEGRLALKITRNLAKNRVSTDEKMFIVKSKSGIFYAVCNGNDLINLMHNSMKERALECYDRKIHCSIAYSTKFGKNLDELILNISVRSHDVEKVNAPEIACFMKSKRPECFVSGGGLNAFSAGTTLKNCDIGEFLQNLP